MQNNDSHYDVAVIGGGPAGLTGAILLARSRRRVVVIDAGQPRNAPAGGVHLVLGHDGIPPHDLLEAGRRELLGYGGTILRDTAVAARPGVEVAARPGFGVTLGGGETITARRLLVTTGLTDVLPDVPGVREHFGRDVVHCPYCHGWEVRDRAIGILGSNEMCVNQALMFRQVSDDVTVFVDGPGVLGAGQREFLSVCGIAVVEGRVTGLDVRDGRVRGVRLDGGRTVPRTAIVVLPRFVAASPVLGDLGLKAVPHPQGSHLGEAYEADPVTGATAVKGLWLAGNVRDLVAQVVTAANQGLAAAATIHTDLIAEDYPRP